jgi:hypothetical protein
MLSRRHAILLAAGCLLVLSRPAVAARPASFQAIDSDSDGKVELEEVKRAASQKFDQLDRKRTGTLSRRQLGRTRLSRKEFAAADPDNDGTLSKDEYLALVEKRFKALDTKNSGALTLEQFNSRAGLPLRRLVY